MQKQWNSTAEKKIGDALIRLQKNGDEADIKIVFTATNKPTKPLMNAQQTMKCQKVAEVTSEAARSEIKRSLK